MWKLGRKKAIWCPDHTTLSSFSLIIHCLDENTFFLNEAVFSRFLSSNASITRYNSHCWWGALLKIVYKNYPTFSPKYESHNLASRLLRYSMLWSRLITLSSLRWSPICLWGAVMEAYFIHCHIPTQKFVFIWFDQIQKPLGFINTFLF